MVKNPGPAYEMLGPYADDLIEWAHQEADRRRKKLGLEPKQWAKEREGIKVANVSSVMSSVINTPATTVSAPVVRITTGKVVSIDSIPAPIRSENEKVAFYGRSCLRKMAKRDKQLLSSSKANGGKTLYFRLERAK
jgi:hypothetical protein